MIAPFFAYIKTIIGFLIFAAFAEMILPSGKWKKYSSILLGLLMLGTLLTPLKGLLNVEALLLPAVSADPIPVEEDNTMVLAIYEENMAAEIAAGLEVPGYTVTGAEVTAAPDGSLLGVHIAVQAEGAEERLVAPVAAFDEAYAGQTDLSADVKTALEESFGLTAQEITVSIQKS